MLARLLFVLTVLPLVELALLLLLGKYTSVSFTLAFVIGTGVLGAVLLRYQGWQTWRNVQRDLQQGKVPTDSLVDGLMILIAGVLLLSPGVMTDLVGFTLLIPACRQWYRTRIVRWLRGQVEKKFGPLPTASHGRTEVIDSYVVTSKPAGESSASRPPVER